MIFSSLGTAVAAFTNLKKRYSKKKSYLRKAKRSGIAQHEIDKRENDFREYHFMNWLDPYLIVRHDPGVENNAEVENNAGFENYTRVENSMAFKRSDSDVIISDDENENEQYEPAQSKDREQDIESIPQTATTIKRTINSQQHNTNKKAKKSITSSLLPLLPNHSNEILQNNMNTGLSETQPTAELKEQDENEIFGSMIASVMKNLPKDLKIQFKHEVNNTIYKFEMMSISEDRQPPPVQCHTVQYHPLHPTPVHPHPSTVYMLPGGCFNGKSNDGIDENV